MPVFTGFLYFKSGYTARLYRKGVFMKKFLLAFLVVGLMFSMAACDSGGDDGGTATALDGTWVHAGDGSELKLDKGNYEYSLHSKGTYKINGDNVTFTMTHRHGSYFQGAIGDPTRYYTKAEVIELGLQMGYSEAEVDAQLGSIFTDFSGTLSEDGNGLEIPGMGYFNRK